MAAAGYSARPSDVIPPPTHHHLPMLHDPETGMGVELHTDVIDRSPDAVISTAWFCEMTRPATFRDRRVRLPEATRNAGHTIYHSGIFHGLYFRNKIQLRHLLDLALIRARHKTAIDWSELDRRFSAAGFGQVLATYLFLAEELLGQAMPALSHAPRVDALPALQTTESRDGFEAKIIDLQTQCNELTTANSLKAAELEDARRAAARAEQKLAAVLSSRSWRLTKPLRAIIAASRGRR